MPALTNEPFLGLAKVQLRDALANGRYWTLSVDDVAPVTATGDQTTWDFQSGDTVAVTLRVEWGLDAGTGIGAPDTINVQVRKPGDTSGIGSTWSFAPAGDTGSATRTLHFDTDPLDQSLAAAGSRRYGLLELYLQVIDNPGGSTNDYTLDSQGAAIVGPPIGTVFSWARGLIRQRATASTLTVSNVSLGGAEPSDWAHPDSVFVRCVTTSAPYENYDTATVRMRRPQAQGGTAERDGPGTVNVDTSTPNLEVSWTDNSGGTPLNNKIGIGMFLGSESKDVDLQFSTGVVFDTVAKAAWASSQPAGFSVIDDQTIRYVGKMTAVDPRIKFTDYHLFQVDDTVYGTPPMSKNVTPAERQDSEFGFVSERARNSRGTGLNSITWTTKLWDTGELSGDETTPTTSRSTTSATVGGEVGWAGSLLSWDEVRPGGLWSKKVVITAPGNAVGLEQDNTQSLLLVVTDPRITLNIAAGDPLYPGNHWRPGSQLVIGARLFRNFAPVAPDSSSGAVGILRFDPATGRLQYLESVSPSVWTYIVNDTDIATYAMAASPGDSALFTKTFTAAQTADFDSRDIFLLCQLTYEGASYNAFSVMEAIGGYHPHDELVELRVRTGNLSAPGRHVIVGEAVTIGAALQDATGAIAMDASSAFYSAQRLNSSTNRLQTWNGTAWVNQTALIYLAMTIGANPLEPLLALATLPSAAVDRTDNIFVFAKCTRTRPGTSYSQPYEGEDTIEVVGSFAPHDAAPSAGSIPESSILFDGTSGHDHTGGTTGRAIGDRG